MTPAKDNPLRHLILYIITIILLNLFYTHANAYSVDRTSTGKEIKWWTVNVPYAINTAGGPSGSLPAIQAAMQTWTDVPGSALTFLFDGTTLSTAWGKNDGNNITCFGYIDDSSVLAQTLTWYNADTGEMLDSDLKFNTEYSWGADGSPEYFDVQNVATHEFGHSAGLADLYADSDSEKTMYGYSSKGETKQRTLDQDDINGVIYLYGKGNITTSTITTTIKTTTTTRITSTIPVYPTTSVTTSAPGTSTTSIIPYREADFVAEPVSGYLPLEVMFTNLSKGDVKYQFWDFGDNSTISADLSPSHIYTKWGNFTVTLTVVFADGKTLKEVKQDYVSVLFPCLFASFLNNQQDIDVLRKLRNSFLDNISWLNLFALYYKHIVEISSIFKEHPELQDELRRLVRENRQHLEEIIILGKTTLRADGLEEVAGFLMQLREQGSAQLQYDIDSVMRGIEDRHLLFELGVSVN
jgi:PKD repeat protein